MQYLPDGTQNTDIQNIENITEQIVFEPHIQQLHIQNSEITSSILNRIEQLPFLTSISLSCCSLPKSTLCFSRNLNRLESLSIQQCNLESVPDFARCRFIQNLNLDGNNIIAIKNVQLEFLRTLSVRDNSINKFEDCSFPRLQCLALSKNKLLNDNFALCAPALINVDVSNNQIRAFEELSGGNCPDLETLDCTDNPLGIASFKCLKTCRYLFSMSVSPLESLCLKDIRMQVLGEFMARSDEVQAIGQNIYEDKFQNNLSFDKQEFEKLRNEAINSMQQPPDLTRTVICGVLGQLTVVNKKQLDVGEKVQMKNWVCPRSTYLAMCSVKEYE